MKYGRICSANSRGHGEVFSVDLPCKTVTTVGLGGLALVEEIGTGYSRRVTMTLWLVCPLPKGAMNGWRERVSLDAEPCRTVKIGGIGGGSYHLQEDLKVPAIPKSDKSKPPYRVPLMAEIAAIPFNGLTVASTFSGCGGSSLGYRMAGFKVLWANEFVSAARDSYRANMREGTILNEADIRRLTPEAVLAEMGLRQGQLDLLDGSPPCASFSTAGKRQAGWGAVKKYSDVSQRTDDLFFEFARLLKGIQPRCFVAENVSGLVKGTAKGYFLEILAALKACGYRVGVRVLDAQWLGVPQQRQRAIFVGVREDLKDSAGQPIQPAHPAPLPYRYSVREAIPWISGLTEDMHGETRDRVEVPSHTVRSSKQGHLKVLHDHPDGTKEQLNLDAPGPNGRAGSKNRGRTDQFIIEAEADMTGLATGRAFDDMDSAGQSDRYFQLVRPSLVEPCPTVTSTGGNPSAASVCHPTQRRKFSIAELRRICAFPDDFVLTGSYAQQWERLGRAVPPLMMRAIAETVRDQILLLDGAKGTARAIPQLKSPAQFSQAAGPARMHDRPMLIGQAPSKLTSTTGCRPFSGFSGSFLAALVGVSLERFLSLVRAVNLINSFPGRSSVKGDDFPMEQARAAAKSLRLTSSTVILAGRAVAEAFGLGDMTPLGRRQVGQRTFILLPHPSGVNTWWNAMANRGAAEKMLREVLGLAVKPAGSAAGK